VKLLLDKGANIEAKNKYENTPLHFAKNVEIIKLLLDKGANIEAKNRYKQTPLFKKTFEVTEVLIEKGANVKVKDSMGRTLLFYTMDYKTQKLLIKKGVDIKIKDSLGRTLLFCDIDYRIAKLLIEKGLDVNAKGTSFGEGTPLHSVKNVEIAKLLLENGANIEAKGHKGMTPLYYAVYYNKNLQIIKLLLEKGANIEAKEKDCGFTPLHCAARLNEVKIVELLLKNGADVEAEDKFGGRVFLRTKNPQILKMLKKAKSKYSRMPFENLLKAYPLTDKKQIIALSDALLEAEANKLPRYLLKPGANPAALKVAVKKRMRDAQMAMTRYKNLAQDLKEAGKNAEAKKYRDISIAISGYQSSLISIMNELNKN
jgi:ankyrin repeat protein